jgi:hypothetical protein
MSSRGRLSSAAAMPEPLLHAQGVALVAVVGALAQVDDLEALLDTGVRNARRAREQPQVAPTRERREEQRRLDERPDRAHDVRQPRRHGLAEQPEVAGVGADEAEEHPDRRRLAGTVGAEEPVHPAGGDVQVQAVECALRRLAPAAVRLVCARDLDHRHGGDARARLDRRWTAAIRTV